MGKLFKYAMFITSFLPLWITIIFINVLSILRSDNNLWTEYIGILVIIIANVFSILIIVQSMGSIQPSEYAYYTVLEAKQEKGITSEFLLSYVLPLFTFNFTQWDGVVQFLIYYIVLLILCVRNNNVYANLLFEVKNYKFYECELKWKAETHASPIQAIVIGKDNVCSQKGNTIQIAQLNKPFFLMKGLEE